jgi:hypothetical protein
MNTNVNGRIRVQTERGYTPSPWYGLQKPATPGTIQTIHIPYYGLIIELDIPDKEGVMAETEAEKQERERREAEAAKHAEDAIRRLLSGQPAQPGD